MPIHQDLKPLYPKNWKEISLRIRHKRAGNQCEFCKAHNHRPHPITGSKVVLTVAHLDHDPTNNDEENLKALCQKCHNQHDGHQRAGNRKRRLAARNGQLALLSTTRTESTPSSKG